MADTDVNGMLVRIEATTAQLRRELATAENSVAGTSKKIDRSLSGVDGAFDRAGKSAQSAAGVIRSALAIAAGAGAVGSLIKQADAYGQMASRMKMVTADTDEYRAVQARLMEISDRTYKPLQEQQELFIKSASSMKELGFSTKDTIDFIDSASSALTINAATSEKGKSAIDALSKAMVKGKLSGDEWNTILEVMPTTVGDLAKSMGKSETAVKQMAAEGKLQTSAYISALLGAQKQNAALAEDMPTTVGDALTRLGNHFGALVGEVSEATGATSVFSGMINDLSDLLADGEITAGAIEGFTSWASTIQVVGKEVSALADLINEFVGDSTNSTFSLGEAFAQMPINLRTAVQVVTVEIASMIDAQLNGAEALAAAFKAIPDGLGAMRAAFDNVRSGMGSIAEARESALQGIFNEREASIAASKAAGDSYRVQHNALGKISEERTAAAKTQTSEELKAQQAAERKAKAAAAQLLKLFSTSEEGYKRQIALINTTGDKQKDATEVQKLAFEVESGKLGKLSETQKKRLSGLAAELDALNKIKKANEDALKLAAFEAAQKTGTQSMQDGFDQDLAGIGQGQKTRDRLRADLALRQKYVADVASLNEQFNAGQISAELYASELGVLESALDKRLEAQHEYYAQLDEAQGEWLNGATEAWANYADAAQNYSQQVNDFVTSQLSTLTSSVGENMAAMILENQSLGESFRNVVNSMVSSLVKGLADMAAQWLIYQAMQLVFGKASEATAVASAAITGTSIAAAYAPAAAMASLASFGANSVPAMAGITSTTGLATTLALTGMAHDGLDAVPATGTWLLEKGERVTTANTSAKLDSTLDALMRSQVYQQAPVARVGAGMLESMGNGEAAMIQPNAGELAPPVQAELPRATRRNQPSVTQNNYYPTQPDNRTANQAAAALARKQRQAARF